MPRLHISEFAARLTASTSFKLQPSGRVGLGIALGEFKKSYPGALVTVFPTPDSLEEMLGLARAHLSAQTKINSSQFSPYTIEHWAAWDHSPFLSIVSSLTPRTDRLKTLRSLVQRQQDGGPHPWIFTTASAWIQPTLPKNQFINHSSRLTVGQNIESRDSLLLQLKKLGYSRSELVQESGQYSIRGEILDVFIPGEPWPIRIEFFDTEVEKIRAFHPENQRTLPSDEPRSQVWLGPAEEVLFPWDKPQAVFEKIKHDCDQRAISRKVRDPIFENLKQGFLPENFRTWLPYVYSEQGQIQDYLPEQFRIVLIQPDQIEEQFKEHLENLRIDETQSYGGHWIAPSFQSLYPKSSPHFQDHCIHASLVVTADAGDKLWVDPFTDLKTSTSKIQNWVDEGYQVWIGSKGQTQQERIRFALQDLANSPSIVLLDVNPRESVVFPADKIIYLNESLLIGRSSATSIKNKKESATSFSDFQSTQELAVGDFIVHIIHGIGKFQGLQELKSQGQSLGEYILLEYAGSDKLYIPVYRLNVIQRYSGALGNPPLDRLGGQQFEKAKQKAKESAKKLAINLLEIYAKRATTCGVQFDRPTESYEQFCDDFPFTETEGQSKAIQDILSDLESGRLLDRLVCGDVGFGKTEVAMRAAYQAVQSGYQVAVLVPTTLLAFQHEQTFKSRMKNSPIRVESISRFKTKREQTAIIQETESGKIDILIGTHRLLSKDVKWKNLGLLMIDEEHRFGVEHKEKIKAIQTQTHTLTLTATPIPRTLNMALSGIKDISLIRTPPTNRQPIQTFIAKGTDELVKTAVDHELSRGGQVFYLHNRVHTIQSRALEIQEMFPNAKVIVAHGQMTEDEIESRMIQFYQGHAQILVCTTIIESGIDVPNAGTILIHRADQLGLAQLYQIRGRVGRSHRKAFAYLLVDEQQTLTQDARLRLEALQRYVELGSGFQIASQDLEIRGGGNVLGAEQSGHIAHVGMDYFTELLEESIQELKGKTKSAEDAHFEPEIQVPLLCEIPSKLVSDPQLRLSIYRKLARAQSDAEVDLLSEEFLDRFGSIPDETLNLLWLIRLKVLLKRVGVEGLVITRQKTVITARKSTLIDGDEVMKIYAGPKSIRDARIQITPDSKIVIELPLNGLKNHTLELEVLFKKIAPKAFENVALG
jgi:transcription-repair coupling factor (superfamily II helicase)